MPTAASGVIGPGSTISLVSAAAAAAASAATVDATAATAATAAAPSALSTLMAFGVPVATTATTPAIFLERKKTRNAD
ncbi:hypothetical protein GGI07_001695 [Coemansia sp. Benny D115]|nr:hypothetical protein GGI07_001695 [Coemansia sp. Benny D115]